VHRSHRRSGFERALGAIGGEVRRCHDCRSRKAWFGSVGLPLLTEGAACERITTVTLLGSGFVVCFLFIWWMISRFTELAG
jgi:hypothetical protein